MFLSFILLVLDIIKKISSNMCLLHTNRNSIYVLLIFDFNFVCTDRDFLHRLPEIIDAFGVKSNENDTKVDGAVGRDEDIMMANIRSMLCTGAASTTSNMVLHSATFECRDCGKHYRHSNNLHRHRRYECGKEPQFMCPYCKYKAKLKDNLKKHVVYKHKAKFT